MKVRSNELSAQEEIETLDALYTAASSLQGRDAVKRFLKDLLTESERIMLGRRVLIARKLLTGSNYDDIAASMKVGHDTIARVHSWLEDQIPGYEEAIKKLLDEEDHRAEKRRIGKMYTDRSWSGVIARLKKTYPLHFLFFPWPKEYKPHVSHISTPITHVQKKRKQKSLRFS